MSAKRKLDDMLGTDDVPETDWKDKPIKPGPTQHSLDSDEEDDDDDVTAYDVLDEDAIEGQEDGIAGVDSGIQITPFNMNEEMEEGHFDTDGMYHWKKEKVIRDNWLENIDWVKIHDKKGSGVSGEVNDDDSNDLPSSGLTNFDEVAIYKEVLSFMKPKETVAKALRRLAGNQSLSSAERWKLKKAGIDTTKEQEECKQNVSKLTELANKILQNTGNMDVYQESFEYISEKVDSATKKQPVIKAPELDMYSDDFDTKEKERLETKEPTASVSEVAKPPEESGGIQWEFKWEKDSVEISGPHSSEQMLNWTENGRFKKDVYVRKCGQIGEFYSSKRIDFDLYI